MKIIFVVALSENNVIGRNNDMPWTLKSDMYFFKMLTTNSVVVMGRKTFLSMGSKPLPNRENIILSKDFTLSENNANLHLARDTDEVLTKSQALIRKLGLANEIYVIGGGVVFETFMPIATTIYLTKIKAKISGDIFFPHFSKLDWTLTEERFFIADERNQYDFSVQRWDRVQKIFKANLEE